MDEVGLGKKIQTARKKAGLTQQELCHKTGLSYSTLAKIERGAIKSPSIFTIQSIASAVALSLDQLVGSLTTKTAESPKKRSKSGVTFVYFDVNGCLVRFFHRAFAAIAEDSGASADVIETAFWHNNDAACRGEISMVEFNRSIGKKIGMPGFNWSKYYLAAVEPITEMQGLLKWVVENYNTGLLTNIMPGLVEALLEKDFIPDLPYKVIVDSSKVGVIKPETKIYEIAEKQAGVSAAEILLVDDSRANLAPAEKQGWHVLWFDDYRPDESAVRIRKALELD